MDRQGLKDNRIQQRDGLPDCNKELAAVTKFVSHSRMHLRLCFPLILWFAVGSVVTSLAQDTGEAATTIRKLEEKWTDSYKNRKISLLSSLLAEDFVITVEDGNTYSKSGYISHSADPSVQVEVAELSDLKVRMHGNTAVVTGAYHERGRSSGKPYEYHDRLTDIWMKTGNQWQVIASHYSVPLKQ